MYEGTDVRGAVRGGFDDARRRQAMLQCGDVALEQPLLLQRFAQVGILAGLAAVLARVAQPRGDLRTPSARDAPARLAGVDDPHG